MEKANVIKALEVCNVNDCISCPYYGVDDCTEKLHVDAIALLKANDMPVKANHIPKYTMVDIYTKTGNLLAYLTDKVVQEQGFQSGDAHMRAVKYYSQEREIQLIAMFRWEQGKCFCKIKCPVNPLPIKGEFEVPSMGVLINFLKTNGWSHKQTVYPRMFK